jgi:hypothetical protein
MTHWEAAACCALACALPCLLLAIVIRADRTERLETSERDERERRHRAELDATRERESADLRSMVQRCHERTPIGEYGKRCAALLTVDGHSPTIARRSSARREIDR